MLKMKPLGFITTSVAPSLLTGCLIPENLDFVTNDVKSTSFAIFDVLVRFGVDLPEFDYHFQNSGGSQPFSSHVVANK